MVIYVLLVIALNKPNANPFLFLPDIFVAFNMPIELGVLIISSFSFKKSAVEGTWPILLE